MGVSGEETIFRPSKQKMGWVGLEPATNALKRALL